MDIKYPSPQPASNICSSSGSKWKAIASFNSSENLE